LEGTLATFQLLAQWLQHDVLQLAATKKEVQRAEGDAEAIGKSRDKLQKRLVEFEVSHGMLTEKVADTDARRVAAENALQDRTKAPAR